MNNISFQGRTNLDLNPRKYAAITNKIKVRTLAPHNNQKMIYWKTFNIEAEPDNLAVIVLGENDGFAKFVPTTRANNNILNEIMTRTDELMKQSKQTLTAWILGGDKLNGKLGRGTVESLNKVADILCDKPNIDASILVGLEKKENFLVRPWTNIFHMTLNKPNNTNLENMFDIVELNNTKLL